MRAGVAATRGDAERAVTLLASAERGFEAARMAHYLSVVRRRRGELIGGDQGKALREAADTWMAAQKMKNLDRITAMLAPGKWR